MALLLSEVFILNRSLIIFLICFLEIGFGITLGFFCVSRILDYCVEVYFIFLVNIDLPNIIIIRKCKLSSELINLSHTDMPRNSLKHIYYQLLIRKKIMQLILIRKY
jgi:hypothetical protein